MVEHLPSKGKVLGSNPIASVKKKLKKKKKKQATIATTYLGT
jgi:hypothetical protein